MKQQMESKEKLERLQTAIKQLIEEEKKGSSSSPLVDSFVAVVKDGDENDDDNRLLSEVLSQVLIQQKRLELESLEQDGIIEKESADERVLSPEIGEKHKGTKEACSCSSEVGNQEIVKELRKVRRQNLITHCLLSVMIILTVAWQLSEVSLLLKLKEGLSHPFKSFGGVIKGMLKRPRINNQEVEKVTSATQNTIVQTAALPGLKIPDLPHVEFPSFDFDSDED